MSKKIEPTFPRKPNESLTDWTLRFLVDAEKRKAEAAKEFDRARHEHLHGRDERGY